MITISDTARLCETAEYGSYALDVAIGQVLGWTPDKIPPAFSVSVDAALRILPDGWFWKCGIGKDVAGWAHVYAPHPSDGLPQDAFYGSATTPVLALCAAALRAFDQVPLCSARPRLHSCPFCGGKALIGQTLDHAWYAMCEQDFCCKIDSYWRTEAEACAAWNTRAAPGCHP